MALTSEIDQVDFDAKSLIDQVLRIFKRKWRSTLLVFSAIVCGVYIALLFTNNTYDSGAQILIKLGRENTQVPITVEKGDVFSTGVQKEEINSYMHLMTSDEIINDVIDQLGLERFQFKLEQPTTIFQRIKYTTKRAVRWARAQLNTLAIKMGLKVRLNDREKVFKLLKENLNVVREKDSNVISVFIRLPDPYLARDVIQKVIDLYQDYHVALNHRENIVEIWESKADRGKLALNAKEKEIEELENKWGLSYPDVQIQALMQNIQTFAMNSNLQVIQREELSKERERLRLQLKEIPKTQIRSEVLEKNPTVTYMEEELAKLRLEEARTLKLYHKDSEVVSLISDRITDLETFLSKEESLNIKGKTIQPNPLYEEVHKEINRIEVDIEGLTASKLAAEERIQLVEKEIKQLKKGNAKRKILQREFSVLESKYYANAERFERAKIEYALDENKIANISILSQPNLSMEPVAPAKMLLMVLGVMLALLTSIGVTLLREWFSQTIYDEKDILDMQDVTFLGGYALPKKSFRTLATT